MDEPGLKKTKVGVFRSKKLCARQFGWGGGLLKGNGGTYTLVKIIKSLIAIKKLTISITNAL